METPRKATAHDPLSSSTSVTSTPLGPLSGSSRASVRKSTVVQLEETISKSLFDKHTERKFLEVPEVKEAMGRISFALQMERGGFASLAEIEEAYSKAATALSDTLAKEDIQKDDELVFQLRLLLVQVNKHLHEVVTLADANKKKPPAHYDKLEDENRELKDEVDRLKHIIQDLELELDTYKRATDNIIYEDEEGNNSINPSNGEPKKGRRVLMEVPRFIAEMDLEHSKQLEEKREKFLERLKDAKSVIVELKAIDITIRQRLSPRGNGFRSSVDFLQQPNNNVENSITANGDSNGKTTAKIKN